MAYLSIFYIAIVFMFSFGYRQNEPHALIKLYKTILINCQCVQTTEYPDAVSSRIAESFFYKLWTNIFVTITFWIYENYEHLDC